MVDRKDISKLAEDISKDVAIEGSQKQPIKDNQIIPPWHVRNVPLETRRKIKVYAAKHGISLSDALTKLINEATVITKSYVHREAS